MIFGLAYHEAGLIGVAAVVIVAGLWLALIALLGGLKP